LPARRGHRSSMNSTSMTDERRATQSPFRGSCIASCSTSSGRRCGTGPRSSAL
jgi:hypothetical protein